MRIKNRILLAVVPAAFLILATAGAGIASDDPSMTHDGADMTHN